MITPQEMKAEETRRRARMKRAAQSIADAALVTSRPLERELMDAVDRGNEEAVKALLKQGAQAEYRGLFHMTPLHLSARAPVSRALLEGGADVNASSTSKASTKFGSGFSMGGNAALQHAAFSGHHEVVRVLLENKADVRARNENGDTALNTAATALQQKIVKMLENPDEAVAKARRELKAALAAEATEKAEAEKEEAKQRRRKETKHRREVEEDSQRVSNDKKKAAAELRETAKEIIPADLAHRLAPLGRYP
jgi:ankyrin repeat protein